MQKSWRTYRGFCALGGFGSTLSLLCTVAGGGWGTRTPKTPFWTSVGFRDRCLVQFGQPSSGGWQARDRT